VELALAGDARPEAIGNAAVSEPAQSGVGGFSRQYLQGIACAVYVGVANGSFLVSDALVGLRPAEASVHAASVLTSMRTNGHPSHRHALL